MSRNIKTRLAAAEARADARRPARSQKEAAVAVLNRALMATLPNDDGASFIEKVFALGERLESGTATPEDDAILASLPGDALQAADMTAARLVLIYHNILKRI